MITVIANPGDYGDVADAAVYFNGTWFQLQSTGGVMIRQFGTAATVGPIGLRAIAKGRFYRRWEVLQKRLSFTDNGKVFVHIARNEGTVPLVLSATYFDVPPPPPTASQNNFRIDAPAPGNCPL